MQKFASVITKLLLICLALFVVIFYVPRTFGIETMSVADSMMEPAISQGDVVYIKSFPLEDLNEDDVVVCETANGRIIRRISKLDKTNRTVITKADALTSYDLPMNTDIICGKVVNTIPQVGRVVDYLATNQGKVVFLAGAIAVIALNFITSRKIKGGFKT